MKRALLAALALLLSLSLSPAHPEETSGKSKPNFVFILGEAHGWSATSVDMDGAEPSHARPVGLTPNLERIAKEGMRFSEFYVSAPRCTPSRASFFTGISPAKLHMTYVNEGGKERRGSGEEVSDAGQRVVPPAPLKELPSEVPTTGTLLGRQGYATAHFGKWHVGRLDPTQHGFDLSDGPNTNQGPERGAPNPRQCFAITERGIEFMKAQVKAEKPFFLQLSHYGVGTEEESTPESYAETMAALPRLSGKTLASAAGVRDMDKAIGQVLAAIEELGIAKNTYIFFSTDHGNQGGNGGRNGSSANPPLTGGKGSVREGGIRVPFLAMGPDIAAGTICGQRATGMDLLPTLLELAGAPLEKPENPDALTTVEGGSLAQVLRSTGAGKIVRPREEIVIHFPHYDLDNGGPASAIFLGEWKLVRNYDTGAITLHDITKDREERHDVAREQPEKVQELLAKLDAYLVAVKAQMPTKAGESPAEPAPPTPPPTDPGERRGRGDKPRRGGGGGNGGGGQQGGNS
jgi:arylsulfatase A-like enzyme